MVGLRAQFVKVGLAGDTCPRGVFSNLVRRKDPDGPGEVGFSGRQVRTLQWDLRNGPFAKPLLGA